MTSRCILHLDMDAFFASVEQRANPWLRGKPVFVCGNRHSRTVVATASYEARAFGVTTGMALHEARRLCPSAILVEGNPSKYADLFNHVAQMMERYSPDLEVVSIDEAFLDLTTTADRFGGALAIGRALQARVEAELGLSCSIGLGPNKLMAKLASSLHKPRGLTQIRSDEIAAILAELPVQALCGIGPAYGELLASEGITTCGALAQVDVRHLIRRVGRSAGMQLARLAHGIDERPIVPVDRTPPAKSVGHLHTLAHDTSDIELMRAVLLELSEKVGRRLRAEQAAGRTVTLTVRDHRFMTSTRSRTLDRFLDDGYDLYRVGCDMLDEMAVARPVRLLGISVSNLSRDARQSWWLPEMRRQAKLASACDQINDRFGEATVRRGTLCRESRAGAHYQLKRAPVAAFAVRGRRELDKALSVG